MADDNKPADPKPAKAAAPSIALLIRNDKTGEVGRCLPHRVAEFAAKGWTQIAGDAGAHRDAVRAKRAAAKKAAEEAAAKAK